MLSRSRSLIPFEPIVDTPAESLAEVTEPIVDTPAEFLAEVNEPINDTPAECPAEINEPIADTPAESPAEVEPPAAKKVKISGKPAAPVDTTQQFELADSQYKVL